VISYSARLDVPRELVQHVAWLLRTERRAAGTRRGTRALTCFYQALLVLVWFRKGEDKTILGAGFGVSRATAYRYIAEAVRVLAAQTPTLHDALSRVAADGWSHVILDGKLFDTDRLAETTTSIKGDTIDAWYSGKHRDFGANIQAVVRPDGLPIWTSDAMPGHLHDLTCAEELDVTAALYWAASQLDLPTLADSGYEGAGQGIHTPVQATIRRPPPRGRQPRIQRRPPIDAVPRRTRLRDPHRTLANPTTQHCEPTEHWRHRPRSPLPHPFRVPLSTRILLRSRQ
jgi:hypothetical protein